MEIKKILRNYGPANLLFLTNFGHRDVTPETAVWESCFYRKFAFTIEVAATSPDEVGHTVGLTQTAIASANIANYEGGGELSQSPLAGLPCMDSWLDPPWGASEIGGRASTRLPPTNETVVVSLAYRPKVTVPVEAADPAGHTQRLDSLFANQVLVLSLYDETARKVHSQWFWSYSLEADWFDPEWKYSNVRLNRGSGAKTVTSKTLPNVLGGEPCSHSRRDWTSGWRDAGADNAGVKGSRRDAP